MTSASPIRPAPTLREMTWPDLAAVAVAERELFPDDAWSEASLWAELAARPRRWYVVAEEDDTLLGYAGCDLAGDVADVMTVAVLPAARGRGLGRRLLGALHARARAAGAGAMMLEVRADNDAARALYVADGYAVVHTRRGYYAAPGGRVDALVMRKELGDE